jgi:hypothetical protein
MALRDEEIQKIKDQWAREADQEERKLVRKDAIGRYYRRGWVAGIVWVAGFMVRRERSDIAKAITQKVNLDHSAYKEADVSDFDLCIIRNII